jgi:Putative auto-transporter adhesin, head GIN domain
MKVSLALCTITLGALLIMGCFNINTRDTIAGSGTVISEDIEVGDFHSVKLSGVGTVYITQGDVNYMQVEMEENLLEYFIIGVQGNTLTIRLKDDTNLRPTKPVNFHVAMPEVKQLSVSGAGKIQGKDLISSKDMKLRISGAGKIGLDVETESISSNISGAGKLSLKGKTGRHTADISGAGKIDAGGMETVSSKIDVSGAGKAVVRATDQLDASISGAGKITCKGKPAQVNKNISGAGKINIID